MDNVIFYAFQGEATLNGATAIRAQQVSSLWLWPLFSVRQRLSGCWLRVDWGQVCRFDTTTGSTATIKAVRPPTPSFFSRPSLLIKFLWR